MEEFIIELQVMTNGKWKTFYHSNITPSERNDCMNVYVESIESSKKDAKVFYDKDEAEKVGRLFSSQFHKFKVIPK